MTPTLLGQSVCGSDFFLWTCEVSGWVNQNIQCYSTYCSDVSDVNGIPINSFPSGLEICGS